MAVIKGPEPRIRALRAVAALNGVIFGCAVLGVPVLVARAGTRALATRAG